MDNGKRSDPDPMCFFCDGSGFLPVADEPERKFKLLEFCKCWAGRESSHYKRQSHRESREFVMQVTREISEPTTMTRPEILAEVEAMIFARLFGGHRWRADRECAPILDRRLKEMGLEERVPGEKETWRSTPLGRELRSDLLMVFLGLWDEWEVPEILEHYGVIDDLECESLWDLLGAGHDPETVLKRYVLQAYFAHYKRPKLLN